MNPILQGVYYIVNLPQNRLNTKSSTIINNDENIIWVLRV